MVGFVIYCVLKWFKIDWKSKSLVLSEQSRKIHCRHNFLFSIIWCKYLVHYPSYPNMYKACTVCALFLLSGNVKNRVGIYLFCFDTISLNIMAKYLFVRAYFSGIRRPLGHRTYFPRKMCPLLLLGITSLFLESNPKKIRVLWK